MVCLILQPEGIPLFNFVDSRSVESCMGVIPVEHEQIWNMGYTFGTSGIVQHVECYLLPGDKQQC